MILREQTGAKHNIVRTLDREPPRRPNTAPKEPTRSTIGGLVRMPVGVADL